MRHRYCDHHLNHLVETWSESSRPALLHLAVASTASCRWKSRPLVGFAAGVELTYLVTLDGKLLTVNWGFQRVLLFSSASSSARKFDQFQQAYGRVLQLPLWLDGHAFYAGLQAARVEQMVAGF